MEVSEYLSTWVDLRASGLAPRTLECYRSLIRLHIAPALAGVDLAWCRPDRLQELLAQLCRDGHARTAELCFVLLRAALADAARAGYLAESPAARLLRPSHRPAPPRWWTEDELRAFLAASRASPWFPAWALALACGLRRGELAGLRWADVDLERGVLHVCNQRQRLAGVGVVDLPPKSSAGVRDIPLADPLPGILAAELRRQRAAAAGGACLPVYVVATRRNSAIDPHQLNRALSRDIARAGLRPINVHGLRHSMATLAISEDVSIRVLQALLGHAHYNTTADIYAHVAERKARAAAVSVAGAAFVT